MVTKRESKLLSVEDLIIKNTFKSILLHSQLVFSVMLCNFSNDKYLSLVSHRFMLLKIYGFTF